MGFTQNAAWNELVMKSCTRQLESTPTPWKVIFLGGGRLKSQKYEAKLEFLGRGNKKLSVAGDGHFLELDIV